MLLLSLECFLCHDHDILCEKTYGVTGGQVSCTLCLRHSHNRMILVIIGKNPSPTSTGDKS